MNNKRKIMILAAISSLAIAMTGCSDSAESSSSTSVDESILRTPVEFHYSEGTVSDDEVSGDDDLNAQDPTAPATDDESSESTTTTSSDKKSSDSDGDSDSDSGDVEYIEVTDANGETVTEYVVVTDAAGETVTDAQGQTQTQAVKVTSAVKGTSGSGNSNQTQTTTSGSDSSNTASDSSDYVSYTDSAYAYWLDVSQNEDFVFNDEFIKVTFKVKEDIPDGAYDVVISNPDFSMIPGKSVDVDNVINGKIFVSTDAETQAAIPDSGFSVYADYVSCKQGDEVTVTFSMKNNPGMCAMLFWFDYDRNAMEIVNCEAVGTFGEIANVSSGT
jgi:Tfp pilus assembly protein FimT